MGERWASVLIHVERGLWGAYTHHYTSNHLQQYLDAILQAFKV